MTYYERKLPHWQPEGAALFITWRLQGSLPQGKFGPASGKEFAEQDRELAKAEGPRWLEDASIARCVADALYYGEQQLHLYDLRAWVILPNHVHILIYPKAELSRITRAVKNFSSRRANELLGRAGEPFWQNESYDHWVRDGRELEKVVRYIESNPVAAGLVERPEDWAWSSAFQQGAGQEAYPTGAKIFV